VDGLVVAATSREKAICAPVIHPVESPRTSHDGRNAIHQDKPDDHEAAVFDVTTRRRNILNEWLLSY
jgi:hypothetical protein